MANQTTKEKTSKKRGIFLKVGIIILLFLVLLSSIVIFFAVPFLSRVLNHTLAQWLWYPALVTLMVFVVCSYILQVKANKASNKKERDENLWSFLSFLWLALISAFVFLQNYYSIIQWKTPYLIPLALALFLLSVLPIYVAGEYNDKHGLTSGDLFNLVKDNLYGIIMVLFFGLLSFALLQQEVSYIFIFGIPSIVLLFWKLIYNFLSAKPVKLIARTSNTFFLISGFCLLIGLTVYLLYLIPENYKDLQNILITIIAAVFGGSITLVGVAWTIRQGQIERAEDRKQLEEDSKQEEIKRAKPLFSFSMLYGDNIDMTGAKVCFTPEDPGRFECYSFIENSDHSVFTMKRLFHDKKWIPLAGNSVCLPNSKTVFCFKINEPFNRTSDIVLEIEDSLGNKYYYSILPLISPLSAKETVNPNKPSSKNKKPEFTIIEIKEILLEELKKRNIPLEDVND